MLPCHDTTGFFNTDIRSHRHRNACLVQWLACRHPPLLDQATLSQLYMDSRATGAHRCINTSQVLKGSTHTHVVMSDAPSEIMLDLFPRSASKWRSCQDMSILFRPRVTTCIGGMCTYDIVSESFP